MSGFLWIVWGVLKALTSQAAQSGLVAEAFKTLEQLGAGRSLELQWIPAHSDYAGNERADVVAKRAAETRPCGPQPIVPLSPAVVQLSIREWARRAHKSAWRTIQDLSKPRFLFGSLIGRPSKI